MFKSSVKTGSTFNDFKTYGIGTEYKTIFNQLLAVEMSVYSRLLLKIPIRGEPEVCGDFAESGRGIGK